MTKEKLPVAEVSSAAAVGLRKLGFRKREGGVFTRELSDAVLGWVGLNRAVQRRDEQLELNPVVGIRNQQVEKLVAELSGRAVHPYVPPTASIHLGYLMPEQRYVPWLFRRGGQIEQIVARMVSAIDVYGGPFMEANLALDRLAETLAAGHAAIPEQRAYRLPVVYLLLGQTRRAAEIIHETIATLGERDDLAARSLRSFVTRFTERLHTTPVVT